jgi:thioredoxin-like negative regulator of GroEL
LLNLFVSQGKVAEALQAAQCINNDGRRSAMLMGAVKTLASSNKPLQARKILAAMPSDSEFDKKDRTSATISLAPVLARSRHLDIALQLANNLALEGRVRTLSKIVAALGRTQKAQRGQIVSTISGASLVGDSFVTDRIWGDVADDLTQAEELDAASLVARRINDAAKRSASFQDIAVAYARKNSLVAAKRCLDEISEPRVRMEAIVDILKLRTEKAS